MTIDNRTNAADVVTKIKAELKKQTKSWKMIATQLGIIVNEYGSGSDTFKSVLKSTGFAKSTALKLASIANSKVLDDKLFEKVHAWSVLYEINTMTEQQIDQLKHELMNPPAYRPSRIPTVSQCKRIKYGVKPSDPYSAVFKIRIDAAAIETGKFTSDEYEEIVAAVTLLQNIAFVRVDETQSYETKAERYLASLRVEIDAIWLKERSDALSQATQKEIEYDEDEMLEIFKVDKEAFFSELKYEIYPSEGDVFEKAKSIVEKKQQKLLAKVNEPYRYANSAITTTMKEAA